MKRVKLRGLLARDDFLVDDLNQMVTQIVAFEDPYEVCESNFWI